MPLTLNYTRDLTHEQRQELSRQLRFSDGGTLLKNFNQATLQNDYMVIVGLGGLGTKAVSRVKTAIRRGCTAQNQDHIQYLAFDTEEDALKKLCVATDKQEALDQNTEAVVIGSGVRGSAAGHVAQPPKHIGAWVSREITANFDGTGAGKVRQAGRLLMSQPDTLTAVTDRLRAALNVMATANDATSRTVVLLAGIAGGTGAGTFLDTAYLIRQLLGNNANVKLSAYLFLPDVLQRKVQDPDSYAALERNAYASLKELDRFMGLNRDHLLKNQGFPENRSQYIHQHSATMECRSDKDIFDSCTLVSGTPANGGALAFTDPEEKALSTVASAIAETLIAPSRQDANGNTFTLASSVLCNENVDVGTKVQAMQNANTFPIDAHFRYNVTGYGELRLPMEECTAYVGSKLLEKMYQQWDRWADQAAVDLVYGDAKGSQLKPTQLLAAANCAVFSIDRESWPSRDEVKGWNFTQVENYFAARVNAHFTRNQAAWDNAGTVACKNLDRAFETIFKDPERGPFYLISLICGNLSDEKGVPLCRKLEGVRGEAYARAQLAKDAQRRMNDENNPVRQRALRTFRDANFLSARKNYESCMELFAEYAKHEFDHRRYTKLAELYDELLNHILAENSTVWSVYTQVITECARILKDDADLTTDPQAKTVGNARMFSWSLMDMREKDPARDRVVAKMDAILNGLDLNQAMDAMTTTMLENRDDWAALIRNGNADKLANAIREFLRAQFRDFLSQSIDAFIDLAYADPNNTSTTARTQAIKTIRTNLESSAAPLFDPTPNMGLTNYVAHDYICVPSACTNLNRDLAAALGRNFVGGIVPVTGTDKLFWYKIYYGLPIYSLLQLRSCDEAYYRLYDAADSKGMNLSEFERPKARNWRRFADPMNKAVWAQHGAIVPARLTAIEQELSALVNGAIACGILKESDAKDANGAAYKTYSMTVITALAGALQERKYLDNSGELMSDEAFLKQTAAGFDRAQYAEALCAGSANRSLALDANAYAAYADAYAQALTANRHNCSVITAPTAELYKHFTVRSREDFIRELRASPQRQDYLYYAIADFETVRRAVEKHNEAVALWDNLQLYKEYRATDVIRHIDVVTLFVYNDGAENPTFPPLLDYRALTAPDNWYPEYQAFVAFAKMLLNETARNGMAAAYNRESMSMASEAADVANALTRGQPTPNSPVTSAYNDRVQGLRTLANRMANGNNGAAHEFNYFGLEADMRARGATELYEGAKKFYRSLAQLLG